MFFAVPRCENQGGWNPRNSSQSAAIPGQFPLSLSQAGTPPAHRANPEMSDNSVEQRIASQESQAWESLSYGRARFSSALQCRTCSVVGLLYPVISLSAVTLKGTVTTQSPSHLTWMHSSVSSFLGPGAAFLWSALPNSSVWPTRSCPLMMIQWVAGSH